MTIKSNKEPGNNGNPRFFHRKNQRAIAPSFLHPLLPHTAMLKEKDTVMQESKEELWETNITPKITVMHTNIE